MKNKLQEYALIAEVISAFAVVLTLIILIFEVRENTAINKATAYQSQIVKFNDWRKEMTSDDSKLSLFNNYNSGEIPDLGTTDFLKLTMLLNTLWGNFESAYTSYSSGIIEGAEWERIQRSICENKSRLRDANLKDQISMRLTSDFTQYVETTCLD
jgi:hypothetical protein